MTSRASLFQRIVTHPLLPVFLVCLLALGLRLYRLEYPATYYFDEVYHGFTAVEYAKGNAEAYNPWAMAPAGVAFEWVHPPLAKMIMSWSVSLFGPHSWAWRLPSALFGTAVIGLSGTLAWLWSRSGRLALLTSTILALDGLILVMSRLAMNDVFFLSFLLLTLICLTLSWQPHRQSQQLGWIMAAATSFGLALACKWTSVYLVPVIGIDFLWRWGRLEKRSEKLFWTFAAAFICLPPVMYLLAHTQYFLWGYTWENFVELQKQIWWYHTNLEATHPYQSIPLQWIFDLRPVWMSSSSTATTLQNIYALGNPIFFWSGLVAVVGLALEVLQQWRRGTFAYNWKITTLLAYFSLWLPWSISPRIMFFYHYTPALPFLAIILAERLTWLERTLKTKRFTLIFLALASVWLVVFFPNLTGLPVSRSWFEAVYFFLPSWR